MNLSAMIWNPDPPVPWFGQFYAPPSDSTQLHEIFNNSNFVHSCTKKSLNLKFTA